MLRRTLALVAAAGLLTACGSTATDTAETSSIAPLTRSAKPSEGAESSTVSTKEPAVPEASRAATAADRPGQEVSSVPTPTPKFTAEGEKFLKEIGDQGVDIAGIEAQLIATAQIVCSGEFGAAVEAVAGQIVEQGRTTKDYNEVLGLIDTSAKKLYCA